MLTQSQMKALENKRDKLYKEAYEKQDYAGALQACIDYTKAIEASMAKNPNKHYPKYEYKYCC